MAHGVYRRTILLLTVCAPAFVPPILRAVPSRQETLCRSKAENEGLPSNSRITEGFFRYRYDNFQRDPEEVWSVWEAAVPDEETKLLLAKLELPEAARWALLTESLRWAARGHDFLRTWTRAAQDLPKESTAVCFSQRSASTSSASSLIRLAVSALAEMLSRSSQAMEKSELCALLWFLEFTLSKQAREEKHISDMQSALQEVLQEERLNNIQPGCKGSDLPACVGDVLTVIHDSCTALGIECPWQKELDGHLDLVLFVNLVYAFEKEKSLWKPVAGSFKAARAAKNLRKAIFTIPLRMDTKKQQYRKLLAAAETDGKKLLDSVFDLGFKESEVDKDVAQRQKEMTTIREDDLQDVEEEIEEQEEDDEDDEDDDDDDEDEMEMEEMGEDQEPDGEIRKLSDVQMRRQARVDWEPEAVLRQIGAEKLSQANKLSRAAMYMHHITAPWKQKFIRDAAKRAGLSGICVFGKPGRILVEGPLEMVASYTARIKSWPWKRCDLEGPWMVNGGRAFDGFREINKASFKKEVAAAGLSDQLKGIRSE